MSRRVNLSRIGGGESVAVQDASQRAISDVQKVGAIYPLGAPTRVLYDDYKARMGELVLLDPTDAALSVTLPDVARSDIGRTITVVNASSSTNAITVRPSRGTIEGATSNSQATAWSKVVYVAVAASPAEKWVKLGEASGSGEAWDYLDTTMPSGVSASPVGLWQLNGDNQYEVDLSGEANDLEIMGTPELFSGVPQIRGFMCYSTSTTPANYLRIAIAGESLEIVDAITIEVLYTHRVMAAKTGLVVGIRTVGEGSEALYEIYACGTAGDSPPAVTATRPQLVYRHCDGGAEVVWETRAGVEVGETSLITLTRANNGVDLCIYINGEFVDSVTASDAVDLENLDYSFFVGYGCVGTVYSLRITPEEFSGSQVLESYNRLRGIL